MAGAGTHWCCWLLVVTNPNCWYTLWRHWFAFVWWLHKSLIHDYIDKHSVSKVDKDDKVASMMTLCLMPCCECWHNRCSIHVWRVINEHNRSRRRRCKAIQTTRMESVKYFLKWKCDPLNTENMHVGGAQYKKELSNQERTNVQVKMLQPIVPPQSKTFSAKVILILSTTSSTSRFSKYKSSENIDQARIAA